MSTAGIPVPGQPCARPGRRLIVSIEQAIARQWSPDRIMRELDATYETYRAVRDRLDRMVKPEREPRRDAQRGAA